MAATKILARGYTWEMNTGTIAVPVWTEVKGLNTWSHSQNSNTADTTSNEDDGAMSHLPSSRGHEFSLAGFTLEDPADGTRDPGQEAVEAAADLVGPDGLKQYRLTSPGGNTRTFLASASVNSGGGGSDDGSAWEATLTVSGTITAGTTP